LPAITIFIGPDVRGFSAGNYINIKVERLTDIRARVNRRTAGTQVQVTALKINKKRVSDYIALAQGLAARVILTSINTKLNIWDFPYKIVYLGPAIPARRDWASFLIEYQIDLKIQGLQLDFETISAGTLVKIRI
jgi:hypothetical protein